MSADKRTCSRCSDTGGEACRLCLYQMISCDDGVDHMLLHFFVGCSGQGMLHTASMQQEQEPQLQEADAYHKHTLR